MTIEKEEILSILDMLNPWWKQKRLKPLPAISRPVLQEVKKWHTGSSLNTAVFLAGPRRVGKTTVLLQYINELLEQGVDPRKILYANFDYSELRLVGFRKLLEIWKETHAFEGGPEYLLLDEMQYVYNWGSEIKIQYDTYKQRKIVFTGSAIPLSYKGKESGVGRWVQIHMGTMSFYEYLCCKNQAVSSVPIIQSIEDLFSWKKSNFEDATRLAESYEIDFRDYLIRGGYPELLSEKDLNRLHDVIRNLVVGPAIRNDAMEEYGLQKIHHVQAVLNYFCLHPGATLNISTLQNRLGEKSPTGKKIVDALLSTQLIGLLGGMVEGKKVLTSRNKVYVVDHSLPAAVFDLGQKSLENSKFAGETVETMVFNHLKIHSPTRPTDMAYWKQVNKNEVDFIFNPLSARVPIEVKYQSKINPIKDIKGLKRFHKDQGFNRGYLITKNLTDFGPMEKISSVGKRSGRLMRIPALLFCYWLGELEFKKRTDIPF